MSTKDIHNKYQILKQKYNKALIKINDLETQNKQLIEDTKRNSFKQKLFR